MSENQIQLFGVHQTPRAGLCALGVSLQAKHFFAPLEARMHIDQKELVYPPIDKLKVCFIGLLGGISGLYLINKVVRADPALRRCWGCSACAEQSTIHRTLVACTPDTVTQLRIACTDVFQQYGQACRHDFQHGLLILDLDLQGQRTSKHAEQATKGYFPGHRNAYGRQLARVVAAQYDEVVVDHLYPGNTALGPLIPTLVEATEAALHLTPDQRWQVVVRIDASGGGEDRIDWLLWRGYQVHIKLKGSDRAYHLAQSVEVWRSDPVHPDRQVGLVGHPYPYVRPTVQVAVRSPRSKGGYAYHVIVSSLAPEQVIALSGSPPEAAWEAEPLILAYANVYDDRGGPIEHSFGEDGQGLNAGKRHRRVFVAQEIRMLLTSLAHDTLVWSRAWLSAGCPDLVTLGILRLVRDVLGMPGQVTFDCHSQPSQITFNRLDPMADQVAAGFCPLLAPLGIAVTLADL
jgi:hypothetical protein